MITEGENGIFSLVGVFDFEFLEHREVGQGECHIESLLQSVLEVSEFAPFENRFVGGDGTDFEVFAIAQGVAVVERHDACQSEGSLALGLEVGSGATLR